MAETELKHTWQCWDYGEGDPAEKNCTRKSSLEYVEGKGDKALLSSCIDKDVSKCGTETMSARRNRKELKDNFSNNWKVQATSILHTNAALYYYHYYFKNLEYEGFHNRLG